MTAEELDMLAELEAKATKGPWKSGCVGQHEDERPVMFYRATGYEPPETITDSMRQGATNLSLVDSLRNAAPALIALAEWAECYRAMFVELDRWADGWCPTQCSCAASAKGLFEQLRKAIAAYPEGE